MFKKNPKEERRPAEPSMSPNPQQMGNPDDLYDDDLILDDDGDFIDPDPQGPVLQKNRTRENGNRGSYTHPEYVDNGDPEIDDEIDRAIERRAEKRRKDRAVRNVFITLIVIILVLAACLAYAKILVPQDSDLPWPSFLGERPSEVPEVFSFLDRSAKDGGKGSGAVEIMSSEAGSSDENTAQAAAGADANAAAAGDAGAAGSGDAGAAGAGGEDAAPGTGGTGAADAGADAAAGADAGKAGAGDAQSGTAAQAPSDANAQTVAQAQLMAAQYDYDGAVQLLQSIPDYQNDQTITDAINQYQTAAASCVAVDVNTVPHIFYHSLVNDPSRAFDPDVMGQSQADGFNAWMVTADEFDQVTQKLYDAGYVYVRLRDLVVETTDPDGTPHFAPNTNLMLPQGKKAIVLSVDDLSYYHSYEPAGFPDKLVLDENGQVKCHYVDANGQESVGDYDVVPRLNSFLAEHPDGCYKGARGLIAMTGYNGVFGYRTDSDYVKREHLMDDQAAWLEAHPDFNYDQEVADAKTVAQALKDEGWEFASHTWGHLSVTDKTADELKADNEKWVANVQDIVGPTDTIIFAHGNDIGNWEGYSADNDKYAYYNSVGYHFFCNVDGSVPYWVQITDKYVRQGRIDIDGYRLWLCLNGEDTSLSQLIDTTGIFSSQRPTPVVANGQS